MTKVPVPGIELIKTFEGCRLLAYSVFGPVTDRAVRQFQARHGLVVDGLVGPHTLASLMAANIA
jgi:murein L,D-transpeptidase YcbB/YkuD